MCGTNRHETKTAESVLDVVSSLGVVARTDRLLYIWVLVDLVVAV